MHTLNACMEDGMQFGYACMQQFMHIQYALHAYINYCMHTLTVILHALNMRIVHVNVVM